jgi:hypothetical protein
MTVKEIILESLDEKLWKFYRNSKEYAQYEKVYKIIKELNELNSDILNSEITEPNNDKPI